jgi:hypothetical protein
VEWRSLPVPILICAHSSGLPARAGISKGKGRKTGAITGPASLKATGKSWPQAGRLIQGPSRRPPTDVCPSQHCDLTKWQKFACDVKERAGPTMTWTPLLALVGLKNHCFFHSRK